MRIFSGWEGDPVPAQLKIWDSYKDSKQGRLRSQQLRFKNRAGTGPSQPENIRGIRLEFCSNIGTHDDVRPMLKFPRLTNDTNAPTNAQRRNARA
jgi:hypothetical protein